MKFVYKNKKKFRNYLKNRKFVYRKIEDYRWFLSVVLIGLLVVGVVYFVPGNLAGNVIKLDKVQENAKNLGITKINNSNNITLENLPDYLNKDEIIKDLPENALINLGIGDEDYVIEKNKVHIGRSSDADIEVLFPLNYLETLGKMGLCLTMKNAKENGDFSVINYKNKFELSWKYKSMAKYKDCLF